MAIETLLMESMAIAFLLFSVILVHEKKRLGNLLHKLENRELTSVTSFSLTWMSHYNRKVLSATPLFHFFTAWLCFGSGVLAFFLFLSAPKLSIIFVVAVGFIVNEEVLEVLEYTKVVTKASLLAMNENDVKCVRAAIDTLKGGTKRYVFYGAVFGLSGFFILQIFDIAVHGASLFMPSSIDQPLAIYTPVLLIVLTVVFSQLIYGRIGRKFKAATLRRD